MTCKAACTVKGFHYGRVGKDDHVHWVNVNWAPERVLHIKLKRISRLAVTMGLLAQ